MYVVSCISFRSVFILPQESDDSADAEGEEDEETPEEDEEEETPRDEL